MANLLTSLTSARSDVTDTRERLAVVLKQGFGAYDAYTAAQPWVFGAGLLAMGVSGLMLWKRRKTPEAYALYVTTFVLGAAAAWFAKPFSFGGASAQAAAADPSAGLLAKLDAKRREYAQEDPQWADRTWARVAAIPGIGDQMNKQPVLKLLIGG